MLFILLGAAYLLGFNGQWRADPDSALYLTLARNLARGQGYTYHGVLHRLVYPGVPEMLAIGFRWFGGHAIFVGDLLILWCGWGALAATYRLFYLACGRPTAVAITLLTGMAREYYRYCDEILVEIPFLLGVMALLAGMEGVFHSRRRVRWWDWGMLAAGAWIAVWTKPMMLVLLPICAVDAVWQGKKRMAMGRAAWAVGIMVASVLIFYACDPRHPWSVAAPTSYETIAERDIEALPMRWRTQVVVNVSDLLEKSASRTVLGTPLGVPGLAPVTGLLIVAGGIALVRFRLAWGLWVGAIVAKLALLYSHDRYLVPILPLLMFGWWRILVGIGAYLPGKVGGLVFGALVGGTFFCNVAMTGIVVVEQRRVPFLASYRHGAYVSLAGMGEDLKRLTGKGDVIMGPTNSSRILTFLADRIAIEPGHPMVTPAAGGRLWVIEADQVEPAEEAWLGELRVELEGAVVARRGELGLRNGIQEPGR